MTETVPADIAAAIDQLARLAFICGNSRVSDRPAIEGAYVAARAALDAAILHHLRAYAEMKAALDLQTSGGA